MFASFHVEINTSDFFFQSSRLFSLDLFIYPLIYSLLSQQIRENCCYYDYAGLQISSAIYICACFLKYICTLVCVCECVYSCSSCFMNHSHSLGNAYIWVCLLLQHFIKLLIPTDTWDAQRKVNGSFSCLKWKQNTCSDICPKLQA